MPLANPGSGPRGSAPARARRPAAAWLLKSGVSCDSSLVNAVNRIAGLPEGEQSTLALGAECYWSRTTVLGASFVCASLGDAEIRPSCPIGDDDENRILFFDRRSKWRR